MKLPWWLPFGRVPEITAPDLAERLGKKPWPQLIDVRTPSEFAGGHVRGAMNLSVSSLASKLDAAKLDQARPVIAICLSGHRSIPAVRLLRQRGYDAQQLAGGMLAWRAQKLPEAKR